MASTTATTELKVIATANLQALTQVKDAISGLDKTIATMAKAMQTASAASDKLVSSLQKGNQTADQVKVNAKAINSAYATLSRGLKAAGDDTAKQVIAFQRLNSTLQSLGQPVTRVSTQMKQLNAATTQTTQATTQMAAATQNAGKAASSASGGFDKFSSSMRQTIVHVTSALIVYRGIVESFSASVFAAAEFDSAMRNVNTIAQESEASFAALSTKVLDVAGSFEYGGASAVSLAEGLYGIESSGFHGADALEILGVSARTAAAGVTDTATASGVLLGILNAYGMGAAQAEHVSDMLFQTVNFGIITFEELASSLGVTISTAAQLGVSVEDLGAAIITMTRNGVPAHETMTSINQVLVSLLDPAEAAKKKFDELGIEWGIGAFEGKTLVDVMLDIEAKTRGNAQAQAELFGNVRALRGVFSILADSGVEFAEMQGELANSAGAMGLAYEQTTKSISFQFKQVFAEIQSAIISDLGPALGQILTMVQAMAPDIINIVGDILDTFIDIGPTIEASLGVVAGAVGLLVDSFSALPSAVQLGLVVIIAFAGTAVKTLQHLTQVATQAFIALTGRSATGASLGVGAAASVIGPTGIITAISAAIFGLDILIDQISGKGLFERIFGGGNETALVLDSTLQAITSELALMKARAEELDPALEDALTVEAFTSGTAIEGLKAMVQQFTELEKTLKEATSFENVGQRLPIFENLSLDQLERILDPQLFAQLEGFVSQLELMFDIKVDSDSALSPQIWAALGGEIESVANGFAELVHNMEATPDVKLSLLAEFLSSLQGEARGTALKALGDDMAGLVAQIMILNDEPLPSWIVTLLAGGEVTGPLIASAGIESFARIARGGLGEVQQAFKDTDQAAADFATEVEGAVKRANDALSGLFDPEKAMLDLERIPLEMEKMWTEAAIRAGEALDENFRDTDAGKALLQTLEDIDGKLQDIDNRGTVFENLERQIGALVAAGEGGLGVFGDIALVLDGIEETDAFAGVKEGLTDLVHTFPNFMNEQIYQQLLAFPAEFRGNVLRNLGDIATEVGAVSITFDELNREFTILTADGKTITVDAEVLEAREGIKGVLDDINNLPPDTALNFDVDDDIYGEIEAVRLAAAGVATNYMLNFMAQVVNMPSANPPAGSGSNFDPNVEPGAPAGRSATARLAGVSPMSRMAQTALIDKQAADEALVVLRSTIPTQEAIIGTIDELAEMSVKVVETFAKWAGFISEEGLESAENFANAASTIYGMIGEALEAGELLATTEVVAPAESQINLLAEMSAKFVEIFGAWASFFVTIGEEGDNINPLMDNADQFASTASNIIGSVEGILEGMNALGEMGSLRPPNIEKINLFAEVIAKFIDAMGSVMTEAHTPENLEGIDAFASTGGGIIDLIGNTIDGLSQLASFTPPDPTQIWNVLSAVKLAVDQTIVLLNELFDTVGANNIDVYSAENMEGLGVFAEGGGAIVDLIANAIESFKGIAKFKPPSPQEIWNVLTSVKEAVDQTLVLLNEIFETDIDIYGAENMESLSAFASGAGDVISLITNTLDAFKGIGQFKPPNVDKIREVLAAAKQVVDLVVEFLFDEQGATLSDAELEKASLWAQTASDIVDLIANGVEALSFKKLPDIDVGAINAFIGQVHEVVKMVVGLIDGSSPYAREDSTISTGLLEKAALWAQTASDIMGIMADGVDAFKALKKFQPPDEDILEDFIEWTRELVRQVADAAQGLEGLEEASALATTAGTIIDIMGGVQEAVDGIKKFKAPSTDVIDEFIGFIKELVKKFGEAARSPELDGLLGAAGNLAEKVSMVMDAINTSFEAFENINNFEGLKSMDAFFESIMQVIIRAGEALGDIPQALLDEAEDASDAIEQAIGEFGQAVESINSINSLRRPSATAITNFIEGIEEIIEALGNTSFEKELVAAARKFNQVIGKAMTNISMAVEAMISMEDFKGPSTEAIDAFVASIVSFLERLVQGLSNSLLIGITEAEMAIAEAANTLMGLISSAASAISSAAEAAVLDVDMDAFMGKLVQAVNDVAAHLNDTMDIDAAIEVLKKLEPFFEELTKLGLIGGTGGGGEAAAGGGGKGGAPAGRPEETDPGPTEAQQRAEERYQKFVATLSESFGNVEIPLADLIGTLDKLKTAAEGLDLLNVRLDALDTAIADAESALADLFSQTWESQMAEAGVSIMEALLAQMRINQGGSIFEDVEDGIESLIDSLRNLFDATKETAQLDRAGTILEGFLKAAMEPFSTTGMAGGFDVNTQNFSLTQAGLANVFGSMGDDMAKFMDKVLKKNGIIGANETVIGADTLTLQGWLSELNAALQVSQAIDAALDAFAEGMTAEEKARSRLIERWDKLYAEWETVGEIAGQIEDNLEGLDPNTQLTKLIFEEAFGALAGDAIAVLESALAAAGMEGVDLFSLTAGELSKILDELGQFGSDQSTIDAALQKLVEIGEGEASTREAQIAQIQELQADIAKYELEKLDVLRLIAEYTAKAAAELELANQPDTGGGGGGGEPPPIIKDYNAMSLATLAKNAGTTDVDELQDKTLMNEIFERFDEIRDVVNREASYGSIAIDIANGMTRLAAIEKWWKSQGYPSNLFDDYADYTNIPGAALGGTFFPRPGGHIIRVAEAGRPETVVPWTASGFPGGGMEINAPITINGVSDPELAAQMVKVHLSEILDEAKSDLRAMVGR